MKCHWVASGDVATATAGLLEIVVAAHGSEAANAFFFLAMH